MNKDILTLHGEENLAKSYPEGFKLAVYDIAHSVCEICLCNDRCTIHHIQPRSVGKTIHKLWNVILLCSDCHTPANYDKKLELLHTHANNMVKYCIQWGKVTNDNWTKLVDSKAIVRDAYRLRFKSDIINAIRTEFPGFNN